MSILVLAEAARASTMTDFAGRDPRAPGDRRRRADGRRRRSARARSYAALKEFGNVTLTTEAARRVWTPWWLEALRDQVERRPLRDPRAREEPGLLAHRRRRAHARHRPERRRLHDAQEHRAQPARRRRRVGPARRRLRRNEHRTRSSRVSYPDYQYLRDHDQRVLGALRHRAVRDRQPGPRPRRPPGLGRARHRQLLSGPRRSRRSAAARCCRRTRSRPAAIRSSCISDGLWRRDFGADPDIVGKTVEINNYPLTVVGVADPTFHGTIVSLRRRGVHSGDDGAAARLHLRQPADDAVGHPRRPPRRGLLSAGLPAAGHDARERRRADRRALGDARRAIGRSTDAGAAAEGRAVLADAERRADRSCCRR